MFKVFPIDSSNYMPYEGMVQCFDKMTPDGKRVACRDTLAGFIDLDNLQVLTCNSEEDSLEMFDGTGWVPAKYTDYGEVVPV